MKVLLVEDDSRDIDLTRRALARAAAPISLHMAASLAEARAHLAQGTPCDLVLTDLTLPDGSGLQLLAEIRERALPLAVVVLTGSESAETALAALKAGADDFLVKRDDYLQRLPVMLETALARFRAESARRSRPLRLLYAENSAIEIELTRRHLARHAPNIRLEAVTGVPELLRRLPRGAAEALPCDVLLLDDRLPDANAVDLLKTLRDERRLDLPVVLVSAQGDGEVAAQALRFGAANCLVKQPGYLFALPAVLEAAHDRAQLAREQAALRESEDRYRDLVESSLDLICTHDLEGRLLSVNPATASALGYSREALLRMNLGDLLTPGTRAHFPAYLAEVKNRRRADGVMAVQTAGGAVRYWEFRNTLRDADVAAPVVRGLAQDITERRLAERAMAESEGRFRTLFEQAAVGVAVNDISTGRFVRVNRKFAGILGYSPEELAGVDFRGITHPDDLTAHLEGRARLLAGTVSEFAVEKRYLRKDGTVVWTHLTLSPMRVPGQASAYHIAVLEDITARKTTENALRLLSTGVAHLSGEAFFNEIAIEMARLLGLEIGFVGRILNVERPLIRTLGFGIDGQVVPSVEYDPAGTPCEEVLGKKIAMFPDRVRQLFPADHMLVELGIEAYAAIPLFDLNGRAIGHLGVMSRAPLQRPEQVESILRLLAVRAAAEIERQREQTRFQELFEMSPDGVIMVDQKGRVTLANRKAESLFGYTREELIGLSVDKMMPDADGASHAASRQQYFADPVPRAMGLRDAVLRARRKDGSTFPADISLSPMHSDEGMLVVATVRDTSERVQAEERRQALEAQLRQAQKMEAIGTLAGGIAHDFNNIVGAILGNIELARQDVGADHPVLQSLGEISKASRRARDLVGQILAFSRQQPQALKVIALAPLAEEVVKLLRATLPAGVELRMTVAEAAPRVLGDATQLHQILMNLCTNAYQAMEDGRGRIDIQIEGVELGADAARIHADLASGRYARVTVRDSGRGMDATTRERIFEPFFTTKAVGGGTGLGLAVVHGIMQNHHGAITVDSQPGSGSSFQLYFPAADAAAETPGAEPAPLAAPQGQGKEVLYLDDDEALVVMSKRLLERQGYRVAGFTDSTEALQALRAAPDRFDLVVTDYNMPGMSGIDVAREVARIRPGLPVALISGYITDELRRKAEECGVRELIYKPNTVEELCAAVSSLTRREP